MDYFKFIEFRKANSPSFRGVYDPDKADEWIKAMEKVNFATYMLEADAEFWWNGV